MSGRKMETKRDTKMATRAAASSMSFSYEQFTLFQARNGRSQRCPGVEARTTDSRGLAVLPGSRRQDSCLGPSDLFFDLPLANQ
jgi:hypothetical protein